MNSTQYWGVMPFYTHSPLENKTSSQLILFYKASIILIPKPEKYIIRKLQTNSSQMQKSSTSRIYWIDPFSVFKASQHSEVTHGIPNLELGINQGPFFPTWKQRPWSIRDAIIDIFEWMKKGRNRMNEQGTHCGFYGKRKHLLSKIIYCWSNSALERTPVLTGRDKAKPIRRAL